MDRAIEEKNQLAFFGMDPTGLNIGRQEEKICIHLDISFKTSKEGRIMEDGPGQLQAAKGFLKDVFDEICQLSKENDQLREEVRTLTSANAELQTQLSGSEGRSWKQQATFEELIDCMLDLPDEIFESEIVSADTTQERIHSVLSHVARTSWRFRMLSQHVQEAAGIWLLELQGLPLTPDQFWEAYETIEGEVTQEWVARLKKTMAGVSNVDLVLGLEKSLRDQERVISKLRDEVVYGKIAVRELCEGTLGISPSTISGALSRWADEATMQTDTVQIVIQGLWDLNVLDKFIELSFTTQAMIAAAVLSNIGTAIDVKWFARRLSEVQRHDENFALLEPKDVLEKVCTHFLRGNTNSTVYRLGAAGVGEITASNNL